MKKIIIPIIVIILLVGGGITAGVIINYNSPEQKTSRALLLAEQYLSEENYDDSIAEFNKVFKTDTSNEEAYLGLSDAYIALGQNENAIETLKAGFEEIGSEVIKDKLDMMLKSKYLELAQKYLSEKKFDDALEQYELVFGIDEKCVEAYFGAADALIGLDKSDNAVEKLQIGFEKTQNEQIEQKVNELKLDKALRLAKKYLDDKNYSSAQQEFKNVLDIDENNVESYIGIADALVGLDKTDSAVENLQIGFEKTGSNELQQKINELNISESFKTAQQFLSEKNFESAKNEFQKVLDINDTYADAYIGIANSYVGLKETDKAIENLQLGFEKTQDKKIEIMRNGMIISNSLQKGSADLNNKNYGSARENFLIVLDIDDKNIEAYRGIAASYSEEGNNDEAIKILQAGVDKTKNINLEENLNSLKKSTALESAQKYLNDGKYNEAISEFNKVLEIDDECSEAYLGSADAYINLGNKDKAIEIFRAGYNKTYNENILTRLNELEKNNALELARQYLAEKEYSKAAEQFQNVLNIDYSCVEAYLGKADAYMGLNDFNSADSILRKGWVNTWNSKIQTKTSEIRLNYISLKPQKCEYEPLNEIVDRILSQITTDDMSTYQKVKACYDYLINNCSYGHAPGLIEILDFEDVDNTKSLYEKSGYIILRDHIGVCDDYSAAFAAMTRAIGLDMKIRGGETATTKTESGFTGHAWCVLMIDGVEYVFDPQVEDNMAQGGAISYARFCKTYDEAPNRYKPYFFVDM